MLGLWLVGIPFVAYLGTAAAVIVAMAVCVAIFVLPAVLMLIGRRVDSLRVPGIKPVSAESERGMGYQLSRAIQRRPWLFMGMSLGILLLAAPILSLRIGSSDAGNNSTKQTTRRAYHLLSQGFGPGFNGVVLVTFADRQSGGRARNPGPGTNSVLHARGRQSVRAALQRRQHRGDNRDHALDLASVGSDERSRAQAAR